MMKETGVGEYDEAYHRSGMASRVANWGTTMRGAHLTRSSRSRAVAAAGSPSSSSLFRRQYLNHDVMSGEVEEHHQESGSGSRSGSPRTNERNYQKHGHRESSPLLIDNSPTATTNNHQQVATIDGQNRGTFLRGGDRSKEPLLHHPSRDERKSRYPRLVVDPYSSSSPTREQDYYQQHQHHQQRTQRQGNVSFDLAGLGTGMNYGNRLQYQPQHWALFEVDPFSGEDDDLVGSQQHRFCSSSARHGRCQCIFGCIGLIALVAVILFAFYWMVKPVPSDAGGDGAHNLTTTSSTTLSTISPTTATTTQVTRISPTTMTITSSGTTPGTRPTTTTTAEPTSTSSTIVSSSTMKTTPAVITSTMKVSTTTTTRRTTTEVPFPTTTTTWSTSKSTTLPITTTTTTPWWPITSSTAPSSSTTAGSTTPPSVFPIGPAPVDLPTVAPPSTTTQQKQ